MTTAQVRCKRILDIAMALIGLTLFGWLILLAAFCAWLSTGGSGFFRQVRVGQHGATFRILKLRTMRVVHGEQTTATAANDPRITRVGAILRKTKVDELPQFWNVLWGDMSVVGPRPDVPGFADQLKGDERAILQLRPGITGLASLVFRHEEDLLAKVNNPEAFNSDVIFPAKVGLNLRYLEDYTLRRDIVYILATFVPSLRVRVAPAFTAS